MRKLFLLSIIVMLFTACSNPDDSSSELVIIDGYFTKSMGEVVYLMELSADDLLKIDSAVIGEDGKFHFEFTPLESPELYVVRSDHFNQAITLLIENGERLEIEGDLTTLNENYSIKKSKGSIRIHELTQIINSRMAKVQVYYKEYRDNPDSLSQKELRIKVDSLLQINQVSVYEEIGIFIKKDPASLSSLLALYSRFGRNTILDFKYDSDLFQMVSDSLIRKYPNSSHAIKLHQKVLEFENADQLKLEREEALSENKIFPEIILNDIDNKPQYLSKCEAKICLVMLWKSTNKESWEVNSVLKDLYKKYSGQGFGIYEISFDTDKLAWANYCHMDKLIWTNVIGYPREKKMLNAEEKLPRIFLLDDKRKILVKDPKVEELDGIISSYLNL
ncbi:MAG: DUF4369 domain-containing protein [Bacteroidales bacterium]|nr:DUF4369 domain-containing protein [Bacteroidales bacterium]